MSIREATESPVEQGSHERVKWWFSAVPWGTAPTSPTMTVYEKISGGYTDVTSGVTTGGSCTITGDVIFCIPIQNLGAGKKYLVEVNFTIAGNILSMFFQILCTF